MKFAVCYDTLYVYKNKLSLERDFLEGSMISEGAERERYYSIIIDSNFNMEISTDKVSNYCNKIRIQEDEYSNELITYPLDKQIPIVDAVDYYKKRIKPILEVSKGYNVDFNNSIPFQNFGNDTESINGSMYSFSDYYKNLLEKFSFFVENIKTDDISDGKYKITINDKYIFNILAWEKLSGVVDNIESMTEVLKTDDLNNYII